MALVLDLVAGADALVEGWRPGVAERLGIGPDDCAARNPRLVYGRMTGWGQDGPLASDAPATTSTTSPWPASSGPSAGPGSDRCPRSTWSVTSAAAGCCSPSAWWPPSSRPRRSGQGQVVDAAMVDGAASLMTMTYAFRQGGLWSEDRGVNMLDTGAPFYEVYETSDGKWFAVGAIERQFYAELHPRSSDSTPRTCPTRWTESSGRP